MIIGEQVSPFRVGKWPPVGSRGKLQQGFQLPRLCLGPLLFKAAERGIRLVEMSADGLGSYRVVDWIRRSLGQVGVSHFEDDCGVGHGVIGWTLRAGFIAFARNFSALIEVVLGPG